MADPGVAAQEEGYELELAEDSPLTEEDLNEIAEQAGRLGLSKEDADKLIVAKESAYKRGLEKATSAYQAKIDAARKEIMADEIFQGEQKAKTFQSITRAIETFGDEQMVALVQSAEFGNNIVLARFLKRLGDAMAPDDAGMTGGKGSNTPQKDSSNNSLKELYPEFFK